MPYLTTLDRERSSQQTRDTTHERSNKATAPGKKANLGAFWQCPFRPATEKEPSLGPVQHPLPSIYLFTVKR